MEKTNDGFKIAQYDLSFRGPGQFLGSNQSGPADLAMEALSDIQAIQQTRLEAQRILAFDPQLKQFPLLQVRLQELERTTHFE
jgi:ATP-dependent DNA helicase RecG